jgi:hypothetical protein
VAKALKIKQIGLLRPQAIRVTKNAVTTGDGVRNTRCVIGAQSVRCIRNADGG